MKNFKKFLTLVLAVMMIVSSVAFSTSAATTKFEDVDADNETLVKAVDLLSYMGVAKGTSATTFGADELVTRQQFALFIYRLMKGGKDAPAGAANTTAFTDLEDATYNYAIAWANAEGIVNGKSATTFAPKDGIKLQEAYAMIVRALDWDESKELVYPFGFIEVAEQKGVELDAGLDSSVNYTDELTRADMAILLHNAFFAETGIEEVEYDERPLSNGDIALVEKTVRPRLCEKTFKVEEVVYEVVATPNYYKAGEKATYDLGYDAIYVKNTDADDTVNPSDAYITAEQLGVDAKELNDLFLGHITMFITVEDNEIDKVLFADCNMTKKTVTDIKLAEVSTNKADSYFVDNGNETEAKLLSGKLVADGEDIYVFNAPYSYANEAYEATDAFAKYETRNSKNLKLISFDMSKENDENLYTVAVNDIVTAADEAAYDADEENYFAGYHAAAAKELAEAFEQVYYGGLYEADLYDVDGDGLYDYINYKPYGVFVVDNDEDYTFTDSFDTNGVVTETVAFGSTNIPAIYTQDATVIGEKFEDEDVVIGYYSYDLELVKVVAVVKPTVDTIANYKKSTGTLTLGSGEKVDGVSAWKKLANFIPAELELDAAGADLDAADASALFAPGVLDDDAIELYIYDGVVLFTDAVTTTAKYTGNLIIPTTLGGKKLVREIDDFDPEVDEDETAYWVYAWVDGKAKYVKVETNADADLWVVDNAGNLAPEFADKLCTYTENDGIYTIYPLAETVKVDGEEVWTELSDVLANLADPEAEEDDQVITDTATQIVKIAGSRFDLGLTGVTVNFKASSKIIVRFEDVAEGEFKYVEYDVASFTKDVAAALTNIQVVLANNADSKTRENLVLLYAETTDKTLFAGETDKNGYRIVSTYEIGEDAEGEWRYFYSLYDPFTGAKVSDVASADSAKKAGSLGTAAVAGTIVDLVDGMVDTDSAYVIDTVDTANLLWIAEVDEADEFFAVIPYDASENKDTIEDYIETAANAAVTDIYGDAIAGNYIAYDENTVVSVVTYAKNNADFWKGASMKLTTMSAVAAAKNELLCYNNKGVDQKSGEYVTRYADLVKAYVSVEAPEDAGDMPVAEFIIVVVNGEEPTALKAND